MKLSEIAQKTKKVEVPLEDLGALTVEYRVYAMTPELEDRFVNSKGIDATLAIFSELVKSWDLLDEDGKPIPLKPSALKKVPSQLITLVLRKILETNRVGEAKGGTSDDGSL